MATANLLAEIVSTVGNNDQFVLLALKIQTTNEGVLKVLTRLGEITSTGITLPQSNSTLLKNKNVLVTACSQKGAPSTHLRAISDAAMGSKTALSVLQKVIKARMQKKVVV